MSLRYRRVLVIVFSQVDPRPALRAVRRFVPRPETLLVAGDSPAALERVQQALAGTDLEAGITLEVAPDAAALVALVEAGEVDLVVDGAGTLVSATLLAEVRRRRPVALLWPRAGPDADAAPVREIGCVALGVSEQRPLGTFLRDRVDPSVRVTALTPTPLAPDALARRLQVAGVDATVVLPPARRGRLRPWITDWTSDTAFDLLVFARLPTAVLLARRWPASILLLPPSPAPVSPSLRALDVPDVVDDGGPLRFRIDPAQEGQEIAFVAQGGIVAQVRVQEGEAVLPAGVGASSVGLFRVGDRPVSEPLAAVEQEVSIVRPGSQPLILFDAELDPELLRTLAAVSGPPLPDRLAVRLRPSQTCGALRGQLRAAGLPARVIDARTVLDEGEALDVSEMNDPVRLARVAARLRTAGFPVTAIVHRGPATPEIPGVVSLSPPGLPPPTRRAPPELITGNRVEIELDNRTGRRWLLESIRQSRQSVLLQVYMASDDPVAREVEAALVEAAARGVTVRILVDSLYALHGSFGIENPLLERLASHPGVSVRAARPVTELPSLKDLKQRDHRKLVVVDGERALIGGRNLSREYYLGFDEVRLDPRTPWPEVPWLDSSVRVEGPAVAAVARSFLEAWEEAGGDSFPIPTPVGGGESAVRVIVHRGLRDANTLEAYRALFDSATDHIYVVNGFPLVLELQQALLRALRRGVRVKALIGQVVPTHGGVPFDGFGALARGAATSLVHSRFDPLVAEGAACALFAVPAQPAWAADLGQVITHVHAKVTSVDGRRCTVGSANLDITSAYWESELMLVVEDAAVTRRLEARIETLFEGAVPLRRDDPQWQQAARRRAWMRHWPGLLSV